MSTAWKVATGIAVGGWFLTPVIAFFVPKIIAFLGFESSREVAKLELSILVDLEKTLPAVDEARMLDRGSKSDSEMNRLNNMAVKLRHAREEADDILDAHEVIQLYRNRCWDHLCGAAANCIACCLGFFSRDLVNNSAEHDHLLPRFGASVDEMADKLKHRLHSAVATFKSSCRRLQQWAGMLMLHHHSVRIYGAVESTMWVVLLWPGKILSTCWNGLRAAVERLCRRWIASVTPTPSTSGSTQTPRPPPPEQVQRPLNSNDLALDIDSMTASLDQQEAISQATLSESASNDGAISDAIVPPGPASVPDDVASNAAFPPSGSTSVPEATPSAGSASHEQSLVPMATHAESAPRQQGVPGVPVTAPSCSSLLDVFKNC